MNHVKISTRLAILTLFVLILFFCAIGVTLCLIAGHTGKLEYFIPAFISLLIAYSIIFILAYKI
jgi:hypothetical protein